MGHSEAIILKHYAKSSAGGHPRISELLTRLWNVCSTRKKSDEQPKQNDGLVDGMGFAQTTVLNKRNLLKIRNEKNDTIDRSERLAYAYVHQSDILISAA